MKKHVLTRREQYVEDWFEIPMLLVTVALLVTLGIPLFFDLPPAWNAFFAISNLLIWFTFYIELFAKVYVAKNKIAALKRNWVLCLIAIAPIFTPFRFMRITRLFRFLRLQTYTSKFKKSVRKVVYSIEYTLLAIGAFVITSGFIMWQVEMRFDGTITSLADALWWAVITVTTIGYGDIIPSSSEGKVFGGIVGILGALFFMVFVARITVMFVHDSNLDKIEALLKKQNKKLDI